jgi:hypothetical protein
MQGQQSSERTEATTTGLILAFRMGFENASIKSLRHAADNLFEYGLKCHRFV